MRIYECINTACHFSEGTGLCYQVRTSKRSGKCPHCRNPLVSVDDILAGRLGMKSQPSGRRAKRMAFYALNRRKALGRCMLQDRNLGSSRLMVPARPTF